MSEDKANFRGALDGHWRKLNKGKRVAFITFVIGAVLLFSFSFLNLMDSVASPFRGSVAQLEKDKDLIKDPETEQNAIAKRIDTDGDGLSDWDEENVYHTSPYLWSTAGDSMPDNVKLALGENPLCKHGEKCNASQMRFDLGSSTLPFVDLVTKTNDVNSTLNEYMLGTSAQAKDFQAQASSTGVDLSWKNQVPRDPAILRKALVDSGKITEDELSKVTDEQLLQMFDDAMTELEQKQANISSSTQPGI